LDLAAGMAAVMAGPGLSHNGHHNGTMGAGGFGTGSPFVNSAGDWKCERCGNINFSHRMRCNRCQFSGTGHMNANRPTPAQCPFTVMVSPSDKAKRGLMASDEAVALALSHFGEVWRVTAFASRQANTGSHKFVRFRDAAAAQAALECAAITVMDRNGLAEGACIRPAYQRRSGSSLGIGATGTPGMMTAGMMTAGMMTAGMPPMVAPSNRVCYSASDGQYANGHGGGVVGGTRGTDGQDANGGSCGGIHGHACPSTVGDGLTNGGTSELPQLPPMTTMHLVSSPQGLTQGLMPLAAGAGGALSMVPGSSTATSAPDPASSLSPGRSAAIDAMSACGTGLLSLPSLGAQLGALDLGNSGGSSPGTPTKSGAATAARNPLGPNMSPRPSPAASLTAAPDLTAPPVSSPGEAPTLRQMGADPRNPVGQVGLAADAVEGVEALVARDGAAPAAAA